MPSLSSPLADLLRQAVAHHQAGQLAKAESAYRAVLDAASEQPDANHNLGVLLAQREQYAEAIPHLKRALETNPAHGQYWLSYAETLLKFGDSEQAQRVVEEGRQRGLAGTQVDWLTEEIQKVLVNQPDWPALRALEEQGQYAALEAEIRREIERCGRRPRLMQLLGVALLHQRKDLLARNCLNLAAVVMPDNVDLLNQRALALNHLGSYDEAHKLYLQALALAPRNVDLLANIGDNLNDAERYEAALPWLKQALAIDPKSVSARANLANALLGLKRHQESWELVRALMAEEQYVTQILLVCARLLIETNEYAHAEAALRQALIQKPNDVTLLSNLTVALGKSGLAEETMRIHRRILELTPENDNTQSNLLFSMNYSGNYTAEERVAEARRYGDLVRQRMHRAGGKAYSRWMCDRHPRRLRVGIVSGDLHQHPVGYFLLGLIPQLDRSRIELVAYSTWPHPDDGVTARLRPHFDRWISLVGVEDRDAAERIHGDGVHVLIDLAGHTAHHRLSMFAWKPAPVQVSWLGYFASTGVAEIDWLIADETGVPAAHRSQFTEKIWYVPDTRLCFSPPDHAPAVSPLPALHNGYVTLGCFQNLSKVSDDVLGLWAKVIARLPGARLRLQTAAFYEEAGRERMLKRLRNAGIDPDMVSLHPSTGRGEYLVAHAEVDLLLDTFPYPGGTTTCEALWMGVPTVTLAGDSLIARQGASLLTAGGLTDWVAHSPDEFVEKAVAFANDLDSLADLRSRLREQVAISPLFDGTKFAENLKQALWGMWRVFSDENVKGAAHGKGKKGTVLVKRKASPAIKEPKQKEMEGFEALYGSGRYPDAEQRARALLAKYPQHPFGWQALARIFRAQGKLQEALAVMRKSTGLAPDNPDVRTDLAHTLYEVGRFLDAVAEYKKSLEIAPDFAPAHFGLGLAFKAMNQWTAASQAFDRAVQLRPDDADACGNLGVMYARMGRYDEAQIHLRHALEIKPDAFCFYSHLLMCLNEQGLVTASGYLNEAKKYGERVSRNVSPFTTWPASIDPESTKLRIGFVSGEFLDHPVGHVLESVLRHLSRDRLELFAYATQPLEDVMTAGLKLQFNAWRTLDSETDDAFAERIRADGIHILIDLSGHTEHNRLGVFARKPAPVQVSWLGHCATTGVKEIDWLFADEIAIPPSDQRWFTEEVWYLPETRACFTIPDDASEIGPLPALENGFVTFACFQDPARISDGIITLWARIFERLPSARLCVQNKQLSDSALREEFLRRLRQQNCTPEQLILVDPSNQVPSLSAYAEIDLILDAFPQCHGLITSEALWMGVPSLILAGDSILARQRLSLLSAAKLTDWVANSDDDYVEKAVEFASDLKNMELLRLRLREHLRQSPLFDGKRFAKRFEEALWNVWKRRM
ncbi:tetratricopeptide repeat protein [Thiobaca trueperi]|uniref:protein O-GlcNAc transferase n=1 Tax=Thiobaca trueperi TaxID=127458 RepID=A0A4R3N1G6_9GAMM|nr:tetratricopeptide repeat protein [Thiobaca trueperi]TCT22880.1 putative O-linked N-acetylglucosamine transferase (SPINDLY family) [Thiobaca trueperi]